MAARYTRRHEPESRSASAGYTARRYGAACGRAPSGPRGLASRRLRRTAALGLLGAAAAASGRLRDPARRRPRPAPRRHRPTAEPADRRPQLRHGLRGQGPPGARGARPDRAATAAPLRAAAGARALRDRVLRPGDGDVPAGAVAGRAARLAGRAGGDRRAAPRALAAARAARRRPPRRRGAERPRRRLHPARPPLPRLGLADAHLRRPTARRARARALQRRLQVTRVVGLARSPGAAPGERPPVDRLRRRVRRPGPSRTCATRSAGASRASTATSTTTPCWFSCRAPWRPAKRYGSRSSTRCASTATPPAAPGTRDRTDRCPSTWRRTRPPSRSSIAPTRRCAPRASSSGRETTGPAGRASAPPG